MRLITLIIAVLLVVPTLAQKKKKDDEIVVPTYEEGITYALPRTGIRIYVKAVREVFEPGPYAVYAGQLLGIENVKTRATVNWHLGEVKIGTFSEPDPEQVHKALGDGAFMLSLAANGCLAGINTGVPGADLSKVWSNKTYQKPDFEDGFSFDYFTDTPTYLPGDSTNNFRPIKVSDEQKAAEAAQRILDCRLNQYDMAALSMDGDEPHPDGKAYEVSLKELKRIEKNYLQLFVGRTNYKKETYSFDFIPESQASSGQVVFRISREKGIVDASDLSGKPVMIEFEQAADLVGKYNENASSENPDAGQSGVYYRMPGVATVKIFHEMNVIATTRTTIAQFGVVAPVPEELLQGNHALEIHTETGAIKSVKRK